MIIKLKDDKNKIFHKEFQTWRSLNPDGYFLTEKTKSKANLHGSSCQHLGDPDLEMELDDGASFTKYYKICGTLKELNIWCQDNGVEVKTCKDCIRDEFLPLDAESYFKTGGMPKLSQSLLWKDQRSTELIRPLNVILELLKRRKNYVFQNLEDWHAKSAALILTRPMGS